MPCEDAAVLAGGSNVLVHLKPTPAVARVMTATAVLHEDVETWLTREVAVGVFLGYRGLAVSPTRLLPAGPHERDGLWMTIWDYVGHESTRSLPGAGDLGDSLRRLHSALADYTGELEPLLGIRDWLAGLDPAPELRARLDELTPLVFESPRPARALHGDASVGNLLRTGEGLLWNDLEDVCTGPVEWDVAGIVTSARTRGATEQYVEEFLDAYGPVDGLADFIAAHELYTTIWQSR
jgi:hypothetical protein